jgi:environmental stress-induced protein Ves
MRILRAAGRRPSPWKNGGGITFEVASFPQASTIEDFGWRISMAEVLDAGAFSEFPNVDRQLAVLDGHLMLEVQGRCVMDLRPNSPVVRFPGDIAARAYLPFGPVSDLNVMTRRGVFQSHITRHSGLGSETLTLTNRNVTVLIALSEVDVIQQENRQKLARRDAVVFEGFEHGSLLLREAAFGAGFQYARIEIMTVG